MVIGQYSDIISDDLGMVQAVLTQKVNAAIVNISGRQRMLSQRAAFFCLQLIQSGAAEERDRLRSQLQATVDLMAKSHHGLIYGDPALNLSGQPSAAVRALYFEPPLNLDQQVQIYLDHIRTLIAAPDEALQIQHPSLVAVTTAAAGDLLAALDAAVSQYERESDTEQRAIALAQEQLYQQQRYAATTAEQRSQALQQALDDLQQAQSQLIQAEKMSSLGQLVAGIAHEINNPVNFIAGNLTHASTYFQDLQDLLALYQHHYPAPVPDIAEKVAEIDLPFLLEDFGKLLKSMDLGAERICEIIRSLRHFSRTDEAEFKTVDLHEGLESTLMILQHRLKGHGQRPPITVQRQYGELPPIPCYPGPLNQVFMNLLANAIDALDDLPTNVPAPRRQITLSTAVVDADWITIAIADTGPGIPSATAAHIFDPFFTTKPIGQGTGMGLAISHQIIVDKHGGSLTCHSTPGIGTQFVIRLPHRRPPRRR